jgi:hypothetical protein
MGGETPAAYMNLHKYANVEVNMNLKQPVIMWIMVFKSDLGVAAPAVSLMGLRPSQFLVDLGFGDTSATFYTMQVTGMAVNMNQTGTGNDGESSSDTGAFRSLASGGVMPSSIHLARLGLHPKIPAAYTHTPCKWANLKRV